MTKQLPPQCDQKNKFTIPLNILKGYGKFVTGSFWRRCSIFIAAVCVISSLVRMHSVKNNQIAPKKNSVTTFAMSDIPPKTVPEGKTASEYYILAFQYKLAGWAEHARDALTRAIKMDGDGQIGSNAKRFLLTRMPRYPVSEKAIVMNIRARNANNRSQRNEAETIWKQCIADYPKFEWPYSNLGDLYMQEGKYKEAEELLNRAVTINPNYVNAWLFLAECKLTENDNAGAQSCVNKASWLEPDDLGIKFTDLKIRLYGLFHK